MQTHASFRVSVLRSPRKKLRRMAGENLVTRFSRFSCTIDVGGAPPLSMQPDQNTDCAQLQRSGLQINRRKSLDEVMDLIGAMVHSPDHTACGDQAPHFFFEPGFHFSSHYAVK